MSPLPPDCDACPKRSAAVDWIKQDRDSVWKWLAITFFAAMCGMLAGTYQPNRNIVTRQDLTSYTDQLKQLSVQVATQGNENASQYSQLSQRLETLENKVSEQHGEEIERQKFEERK